MTKDLGRISALTFAIAGLDTWLKACEIIKRETGIEIEDEPQRGLQAAKKKLKQLEKL